VQVNPEDRVVDTGPAVPPRPADDDGAPIDELPPDPVE
jgi:hypothetical protein